MKKSTRLTILGYAFMFGSWIDIGSFISIMLGTIALVLFLSAMVMRYAKDN